MTAVPIVPTFLEDCEFIVDADDYSAHVSRVEIVPSRTSVQWRGMSKGSTHNRSGRGSHVANVDYAQDWTTPKSFSRYLAAHDGEIKTVRFQPVKGSGEPSFTVDVQIVAGPIGGAVDTIAVGSVSLPCQGAPVPDYDDDPITPNPAD